MLWWQDETSGQDLERGGGGQEVQKTVMIKKWISLLFSFEFVRVREIFTFDLIDIYSQKVDQVFYDSLYHRKWGKRADRKSASSNKIFGHFKLEICHLLMNLFGSSFICKMEKA